MLGRKAQSGRTRQGPPAVWPSRRIEGPWLRATAATRLPVKAARPHHKPIGRRSLLEDARPHHHPGRNRPPLASQSTLCHRAPAHGDRLRHCIGVAWTNDASLSEGVVVAPCYLRLYYRTHLTWPFTHKALALVPFGSDARH
jgi:hypothetical protein